MIENYTINSKIITLLTNERIHQDTKHGEGNAMLEPFSKDMISYLVEELGEAAQVLNDYKTSNSEIEKNELKVFYIAELTQVAALCVQEIERILNSQNS